MATRRRFAKREHPAVLQRRNHAYLSSIIPPEQRERFDRDFPEAALPALPKKRGPRVDHDDLEKHVISDVSELLAAHPKVLLAVRQNSGSLPYDRDGRPVPIWFYRIVRDPSDITLTDFWGFLRDGRPFALEAKKPSWKWSGEEREIKQRACIQAIEAIGGIGGFVCSIDDAKAILDA